MDQKLRNLMQQISSTPAPLFLLILKWRLRILRAQYRDMKLGRIPSSSKRFLYIITINNDKIISISQLHQDAITFFLPRSLVFFLENARGISSNKAEGWSGVTGIPFDRQHHFFKFTRMPILLLTSVRPCCPFLLFVFGWWVCGRSGMISRTRSKENTNKRAKYCKM